MELNTLRIFIEVFKCGSYAAVARQQDIDPSKVSRAIAGLEHELGFRLFQRTTRKLSATEAGSLYFDRVETLVEELETANVKMRDLVNQPRGNLRVTACTSFGQRILVPHLDKIRNLYPDLKIELILTDSQVDIIAEKIDVGIRFGTKPQGNLMAQELAPRKFHVCASPNFLRQHGRPKSPEDLGKFDCVLFPGYRNSWAFRQENTPEFSVPVTGHFMISHGMTMTACAVQGLGVALLPDWLCNKEIERGELIDLFPTYEATGTDFDSAAWIIYPRASYLPLKLRVFIDFLLKEVRDY